MANLNDGLARGNWYSTVLSGTNLFSTSGTIQNLTVGTASISGLEVDTTFPSASIGSPQRYNTSFQAGSSVTSAGSLGFTTFGKVFPSTEYYITLSPRNFVDGAGSVVPYASGVYATSGVNFVGAASTAYNWIAIGSGRV